MLLHSEQWKIDKMNNAKSQKLSYTWTDLNKAAWTSKVNKIFNEPGEWKKLSLIITKLKRNFWLNRRQRKNIQNAKRYAWVKLVYSQAKLAQQKEKNVLISYAESSHVLH